MPRLALLVAAARAKQPLGGNRQIRHRFRAGIFTGRLTPAYTLADGYDARSYAMTNHELRKR
jgi:hypothetical protein